MPRTAYFVALYMLWPGIEISPNSEEMLTRWPSPEAIRCGRNSLVPCTTPQKLMPMIQSMSSYSRSIEVAGQRDAGVVDDHVDPAEVLGHGGGVRRERGAVGHVEAVGADLAGAGVLDQVDGLGEPGLVDVGEREQRALAGEVERQRAADAGAGAGDHDDLVVEATSCGARPGSRRGDVGRRTS